MADPTADTLQNLNQEILTWTRLQVPKDLELDTEWAGLVQPLIRASGHEGSRWAKTPAFRHDSSGWKTTLDRREFIASPSAQLYQENLKSRGKIHVSSHETFSRRIVHIDALLKSYVLFFWIYFSAPAFVKRPEELMVRIFVTKNVNFIFLQRCEPPTPNLLHGQEAQLMLWPHFWRNAEATEYRHRGKYTRSGNPIFGGRTLLERFGDLLDKVGPMKWKKDFVDLKPITYV
ncbi:Dimeric alpha-beta barrel [Penicillium antarcticum]|uniref:Dimeric alpha-beta barrel n=1 Tax=Penicillium antarcticum TaxID=416450 RepID=UPI002393C20C|nr:Dimeric alpha-beta barrel [Penicillium antarcticum]KAJ5317526.1 Dimeric alpha-beta barrel [Penicillium antarcticum]